MSHPVFLSASPNRRMPDGSVNEWKKFFVEKSDDELPDELEANCFIPLLWLALFAPSDVQWARMIDNEDMGTEARQDLADSFGESQYPYLVTSTEEALANFRARKPILISKLGQQFALLLVEFERYVEKLAPFALLRTSALPDIESSDKDTKFDLPRFEWTVQSIVDDLAKNPEKTLYLVSGEGGSWPPPSLQEQFPTRRSSSRSASGPDTTPTKKVFPKLVLEWLLAVLLGVLTVAAWIYSGSGWVAAICFVLGVVLIGLSASVAHKHN